MASSAVSLPPPPPSQPIPNSPQLRSASAFSPPNPKFQTPTIRYRLSKICQEGNPNLARQLFDTIPKPTTVLWNTLIIGLICNQMPFEAMQFYARMKKSSAKADSYTYSSTLKACAETQSLRIGKAVHCHFIRCLSNPSRIIYNSLLNMYVTCLDVSDTETNYDDIDVVRKVFDSMRKRDVIAWNTLISWYVKTERHMEAIRQFKMMMKFSIQPSPVSFVNVFPALSSIGDIKIATSFYGLLLKLGEDYANDLFVVSSAIFLCAELGSLAYARKIFDLCLERNTEIWNSMVGAYVQSNCPVEGIKLFVQAVASEETVVDEVTILSVLSAISTLRILELGRQLHAYIIKTFPDIRIVILNSVITMYSKCDATHTSFKVFDLMPERDVVSWNTMISAFVQNGLDDEGLMLVYAMQKQGYKPDAVTLTVILSAASNLRNKEIGEQTHAFLIRHGISFKGMTGYLIDMYAKSGLMRIAQQLFEKTCNADRDQATWNALISGYTQNGLTEEAFETFRYMLEQNITPNGITLASILPACSQIVSLDLGKQLHGFSIRYLVDKNVFVATALVDMYSKLGSINYGEEIFAMAEDKTSVTYTTMILSYGQHGMGERAVSLFHSMQHCGFIPDNITFVAVLSACSHSGLVDEGLRIFNSMEREHNVKPSVGHFCCVVDMLGKVGRVDEAYELIKGLGKEGDAPEVWGTLLGPCRLHGNLELGEAVAMKLIEMAKGETFAGYQVLLSNMYAEEGNWCGVDRVRKAMREQGLKKEVGHSCIEIGGRLNCFVSKDQRHFWCDEIYETLDILATTMKTPFAESFPTPEIGISGFDE